MHAPSPKSAALGGIVAAEVLVAGAHAELLGRGTLGRDGVRIDPGVAVREPVEGREHRVEPEQIPGALSRSRRERGVRDDRDRGGPGERLYRAAGKAGPRRSPGEPEETFGFVEVPACERIERRESVNPNPLGRAVDDRLEGSDRPRMPRPGAAEEPRGVHDRDGHVGERPGQVLPGDPGHTGVHDRDRPMMGEHGFDRRTNPCLSAQHRICAREVGAPEIDPKEGRWVEPAARRAMDHDSEPVVGREGCDRTDHGAGHERPGAAAAAQSSRPQRERRRATPAVPTGAGSGTGTGPPADSRVIPSATANSGPSAGHR